MSEKELIQCAALCAAAFVLGVLVGKGKIKLPGRQDEAAALPDPMTWFAEWGRV